MAGASTARPICCEHDLSSIWYTRLTVALLIHTINTGTSNEDIVSDREYAFTTNPSSISASDPSIMEDSCFIQLHTTIMDLASKRHLFRMKVVEAGFASDLVRMIAQDVGNGFGSKQNVRIWGEI